MNLSIFSLKQLVKYVNGDEIPTVSRTSSELVDLFNANGMRDIYDQGNGGLPKLDGRTLNTSRTDYTFDRLKRINDSSNLSKLILTIIHDCNSDETVEVVEGINKILSQEGYKLECLGESYEIIGIEPEEEIEEIDYQFDEIESRVILELNKAEFTVWVAMAWFTNIKIHAKLTDLKSKGVNVQVITIDDSINRKHGCSIDEFEGKRIAQWGMYNSNKMHDKYCVIDFKTVITGSYNWTSAAEYNNENVSILKSRKAAEAYSKEFIKLKMSKAN